MSEMANRVARALFDHWCDRTPAERDRIWAMPGVQDPWIKSARAAIEALRDLPPGLLAHIQNGEIDISYENVPIDVTFNHSYDAAGFWKAFVGKMLK